MSAALPILPGCSVLPPFEPAATVAVNEQRKRPTRKTADRFAVLNAFIDVTAGQLSRSQIMVWFVLYRDTKNGVAKTSQANIARRAGISVRTAKRAVDYLRKRGLLSTVRQGGLRQGPSTYRVHPLEESFKATQESCL